MNLTHLEQFCVIARCENMAEASEILHVSQPALSYSLSKLEDELGVKLFDRTRHRIVLNDAGRDALEYASEIIGSVERMTDYFKSYSSRTVELRFYSSSASAMRYFIPRFIAQTEGIRASFSMAMPDDIRQMVLSFECDIGLTTEEKDDDRLKYVFLCEDHLHLMVPQGHRLKEKDTCRFRDFSGETIITTNEDIPIVNAIRELSKRYRVNVIHCDDYMVYRNLCQTTDYLFCTGSLGFSYYGQELQQRTPVMITDRETTDRIYVVYSRKKVKKVSPFLEWLEANRDELI